MGVGEYKEGYPTRTHKREKDFELPRRSKLPKAAFLIGTMVAVTQMAYRGGRADYFDIANRVEPVVRTASGLFQGEKSPGDVAKAIIEKNPTYFNLVYPGLSGEDLENAKEQVIEASQLSLDLGRISRTLKYEGQIREIAREQGVPEELFLGFVAYESEGYPDSVGPVGERGFTQMTAEMANRYGLQTSEGEGDERFDPGKILPASAEELKGYYDKFGNWGLAFQAWNVGEPQLYELLNIYFDNAHNEYLPSIEETPESEVPEVIKQYKDKIEEHGVTVYQLFNNSQVQIAIAGSGFAGTDWYVPRIAGAAAAVEGFKTIAKS